MVAQNELRDARDRQNANDQAIATELNRYQTQMERFRKGFYMNIQFHIKLRTLQIAEYFKLLHRKSLYKK